MGVWIVGGAAFLVTLATAPFVRRALIRYDVVDRPNSRSSHALPTPRGGGIACGLGIATAVVVAAALGFHVAWEAFAAALAMAFVGFIDDRFTLRAGPRLAAQVVAGIALGASVGGIGWAVIGAFVLPAVVNVVNFMDGINGITALTMSVWGATALLAGAAYGVQELSIIGAATAGVALGFLPWNAPRARLFLGDVGSYLLGALAAGGVLVGGASGSVPLVLLLAPLAIFGADAAVTLAQRAIRGADLTVAHREHTYQRLVHERGMSHVVVAVWAALLAAMVVLVWTSTEPLVAIASTAVVLVLYLSSDMALARLRDRARLSRSIGTMP